MSRQVNRILERNYIPVGTTITSGEMAQLPQSFLSNRRILDPDYAGFEPNFQWSKYITLDFDDQIMRMRTSNSLHQMSRTPEGQHIIRQAAAMQAQIQNDPAAKLHICSGPTNAYINMGDQTALWLNRNEMERTEFLTTNGSYMDLSAQHTLIHEMLHAADPLSHPTNREAYFNTHGRSYLATVTELGRTEFEAMRSVYGQQSTVKQSFAPAPRRVEGQGVRSLHAPARQSLLDRATDTIQQWTKNVKSWFSGDDSEPPERIAPAPVQQDASELPNWFEQLPRARQQQITALRERRDAIHQNVQAPIFEFPAIHQTNMLMARYFNELPRVLDHAAARIEPENERYINRPELGGDHFYDRIRTPATGFKAQEPARGKR